ncbi:hypothetical protein L3Q82_024330 [Scortum barcoo]|uniref:Uncharacterized protein n=1 Tax=Scortum barcoo TaxID=214431 RepID=A0ACB8WVM1_9TELE|nr:hypothetical protein L3Q82_024330 [Scortum barcoo]
MSRQQHRTPLRPSDSLVEVKSKFEAEYRRFALKRNGPGGFQEFYRLLQTIHHIPGVDVLLGYADVHGDLLPINNDDNFHKAVSSANPLLRIIITKKGALFTVCSKHSTRLFTTIVLEPELIWTLCSDYCNLTTSWCLLHIQESHRPTWSDRTPSSASDGIPYFRCPPPRVRGLPPRQAPETLRPQLRTAASTMEAENMVHSDSMSPASLGICEKLFRRWELKTSLTEGSARRSQQTLTIRLGLPAQKSNNRTPLRVQIGEAVPPDHAPPGITVVAHVSVEVPSRTMESPVGALSSTPPKGLQEGRVLCTAVRPVGTNNSKRPIPNPKAQGSDPLVHRGELQHMAAELGSYKQAHTSSPPLTLGNSRVVEGPAPLKKLGSRAQAMRGGIGSSRPPPRLLPKPHCTGPSWTFLRVVSLLEGGPTSPFRAEPGRVPWAKTQPPGARLRAPTPGLAPGWGPEDEPAVFGTNSLQRRKKGLGLTGLRTTGSGSTQSKNKPGLMIGMPQNFRQISSIIDVDILPETHRRVRLHKHGTHKPLGFYIRDGVSVRVTPQGVEKVPGVFISRLVRGGLAESTGLLGVNDEILEVNGIDVAGKSLDQVTDMMVANSHNLIVTVKPANQRNNVVHRGSKTSVGNYGSVGSAGSTGSAPSHDSPSPASQSNPITASNSIAEGDSDDEDDDGDLILENDCLTPFDSQRLTNSNNTNLNRDSPSNRPHNSTVVRPLPQSVSLPNSVGASLSDSSMMMSNHNGNPQTSSSSQESMREDGNIITL